MEEIFFTLNQAANQAKLSKTTTSRAINNGKLPNTQQQSDGLYRIPLSDLVAVGCLDTVRSTKNDDREHEGVSSVPGEQLELRHELELVEQQLKAKEEQLQQMERLIATQERALNALENSRTALEAPKAHGGGCRHCRTASSTRTTGARTKENHRPTMVETVDRQK
ncbi:MAG: hypothetical protein Q3976_08550 [Corynebacterium sp.]|nr:hypothetical protein [Corynebacterium sp.]